MASGYIGMKPWNLITYSWLTLMAVQPLTIPYIEILYIPNSLSGFTMGTISMKSVWAWMMVVDPKSTVCNVPAARCMYLCIFMDN